MNDIERGVLLLLKSAITGESYVLPEHFDLEQGYRLMKHHNVLPLCYVGARNCGLKKTESIVQKLFQAYCMATFVSERQLKAVQQIYDVFDQELIDYMPVKGCNMKYLYPEPALRSMGDADILIRLEQYDRIRPIMKKLGYQELLESDHELDWSSPTLLVELHKRLIPSYNQDYFRYYGDGWRLAASAQGTRYSMTAEDSFIYIFTHLAKHYRDGGIGCRHVLDLWVYRRRFPELNMDYVHQELEKLELLEFYQNLEKVLSYWFQDQLPDERTEFISEFLLHSGTWGSKESRAISNGTRHSAEEKSIQCGRAKQFAKLVFPASSVLQKRYPFLKKHPCTLPLFWVRRWGEALLFRRKNVTSAMNEMRVATADNIKEYQQSLDYVGLRFKFEE